MVSRAFGLRSFGTIYGWLALALGGGVAVGPIAISALLRLGGSYQWPLIAIIAVTLVALGLVLVLKDQDFSRKAEGAH